MDDGGRMHADQHDVPAETARRLIAEQYPQWAEQPVRRVSGSGTVNAIFRIGDDLAARFPLQGTDAEAVRVQLAAEAAAAAEFADCCPVPAPHPVTIGEPGDGFPLPWVVQTWLSGRVATPDSAASAASLADDLAALIRALRDHPTRDRRFSGGGRGGELRSHDAWVDRCLHESEGLLDVATLRRLWTSLRVLPHHAADVMSHGDLIPANLLVDDGRLTGVLDTGGFGPADPALDLVAGWHLLDTPARGVLREGVASDDLEWARGAAWAFVQAIGLVWYYRLSNPAMAALGRSTLARLTADRTTYVYPNS